MREEEEVQNATPEQTANIAAVLNDSSQLTDAAATTAAAEEGQTQPLSATDAAEYRRTMRKFPVVELFGPTIQGEGAMAGAQTFFIRFGGCDFRCKMCDSMHAVEPRAIKKHAVMMTADEIAEKLAEMSAVNDVRWVTYSGGNPAMWDLSYLTECLQAMHFKIAVETQGTLFQTYLGQVNQLTVSPKGPGMGEEFDPEQLDSFMQKLEDCARDDLDINFKVVVFDQRDLEFAKQIRTWLEDYMGADVFAEEESLFLSLGNPWPPIVGPDYEVDTRWRGNDEGQEVTLLKLYKTIVEDVLQDPDLSAWRFLPQLHVLVWGSEKGR